MKKGLMIILMFVLSLNFVLSATYYVSNSGDDANDGLTSATPFKTITKLMTVGTTGDTYLFNRDDVWYCDEDAYVTINSGNRITSYGTGDDAKFFGGKRVYSGNWSACGTNLWCLNTTSDADYMLWFNNFGIVGLYNDSVAKLTQQGHFYRSVTNLTMYSVGNPNSYYTDVYMAREKDIFDASRKHSVTLEDVYMIGTARHGFGCDDSCNNTLVQNTMAMYIGGGIYPKGTITYYGNAYQLFGSGVNFTVRNNIAYQVLDAGFTQQYTNTSGHFGIGNGMVWSNNICYHCGYCWELWNDDENVFWNNTAFEHNTCIASDAGIFEYMRHQSSQTIMERGVRMGGLNQSWNYNFTNNIVVDANEYAIGSPYGIEGFYTDAAVYNSDYNVIWRDITGGFTKGGTAGIMVRWKNVSSDTARNYATLAEFVGGGDVDKHSLSENVTFVDLAGFDFRPVYGSSVCLGSSTGSYIGALPCQDTPPSTPSGGAATSVTGDIVDLDLGVNTLGEFFDWFSGLHFEFPFSGKMVIVPFWLILIVLIVFGYRWK